MKKKTDRRNRFDLLVPLLLLGVTAFGGACGGGGGGDGSGGSSSPSPAPSAPPQLALSGFVSGLNKPVGLEAPDDGTGRLFVLEQAGTIRIIRNGSLLPAPFLDLAAKVESGGEKGLLGLAFHPRFGANRRFFVNYTRRVNLQLQSVASEFAASPADPDRADPASERQLLILDQPAENHNGGQLAFGPDGFLYLGFGDGGGEGDPFGNAQNPQTLLGKILRLDVDGPSPPGSNTPSPRTTLSPAAEASRRSGPWACGIPGGFPSTGPPGGSSPPTWARTALRKST